MRVNCKIHGRQLMASVLVGTKRLYECEKCLDEKKLTGLIQGAEPLELQRQTVQEVDAD